MRRGVAVVVAGAVAVAVSVVSPPSATAVVAATQISTAQYPLALDVDDSGNVWIGYKDGPLTPKGVTVVPAASGTLFGVPVTAGVETRIFAVDNIQGILMSPGGTLFVATEAEVLYAATETASTVFGVSTPADTLTQIAAGNLFRGGLAMDSTGNLFGARMGPGGVAVLPAVSGTLYGQAVTANTPALFTPPGVTWGGWEVDLAFDSQDNLYVTRWYTVTQPHPNGVYVLPKVTGTLYGQSVTANTLVRFAPFSALIDEAVGVDVDDSDNIYVSKSRGLIFALSPETRFVMGQTLTSNTAAFIVGSDGNTGQGIAVVPDGSSLISGAVGSTRRLVPQPSPPVGRIAPLISGNFDVGQTLTASGGPWSGDPAPTSSFQWQECNITGPPGTDWLSRASASDISWNSVTWGGPAGNELFVAVGSAFGSSNVMTSPDGITWTSQTPAADGVWTSVAWGGPAGSELFVAVASFTFGARVMTSPDGITWTSRTSAADSLTWNSVTWGGPTGQQRFVAVADSGTGNRVMTSTDGITWTSQTSAADNAWRSVTWGGPAGQQRFVAVASSGTGNRVMTSSDGITWTSQTSAADNAWRSVTWGGPAGQQRFVAVADSGTGNRVMTSSGGITWTSQTSAADNAWRSVTWGGPAGQELFVAVAELGSSNLVMTSVNGLAWSLQTPAATLPWRSVTWGESSDSPILVAVAGSGSGNLVMTSSSSLACTDIPGAAGTTYILTNDDRSKVLRVRETATNIFASVSAVSSGVGPVPANVGPPTAPRIPPGPPSDVRAEPTALGARVTWKPPLEPGTDSLSLYAARSWPGGPACQVSASLTSCEVAGLDPDVDYYFTVVAMSGAGWGQPSEPSNTIRPRSPQVPSAPLAVTASAGSGEAIVSWSPPMEPGSSPVLEYRVTSTPGGAACATESTTCTISGLTNGVAYRFTVQARNSSGWGAESTASSPVTPSEPRLVITATRGGRLVVVNGSSAGLVAGTPVTVWTRTGTDPAFVVAAKSSVVRADGSFAWQRRLNPAKAIEVYVATETIRSNAVTLPPRG